MPKMVQLEIVPGWKPSVENRGIKTGGDQKKVLSELGASIAKPMPYVTAMQNIRLAPRGALRIKQSAPKTGVTIETNLEDMPTEQLKIMMLTAGAKPTKKQMSRAEIITVIRTKLGEFEVADPED